ncbi:MAG TPA: DNA methyltransferase [Allosphingosinicella sp.]
MAREIKALQLRRAFGLNFERHQPEAVELPGRPVRRGDKVRLLPDRGSAANGDQRLWTVKAVDTGKARLELAGTTEQDTLEAAVTDLVVVAEFRDFIFPGLVSTGKIERAEDKPFHTVINAENFHALQALTWTHRGKIDVIYIDPPYNSGAKDWKYNNDYVEADDHYRHSKWLAMIERRLVIARELLNPRDSALIVTIDEKEVHRLALLLEQVFPEANIQTVASVINPQGTGRTNEFSRTNEYLFFAMFGNVQIQPGSDNMFDRNESRTNVPIEWRNLRRRERESVRGARPNQFYPVFVDNVTGRIHSVGDALADGVPRRSIAAPDGTRAVFPLSPEGKEMLWGVVPERLRFLAERGYARVRGGNNVQFLNSGTVRAIESGELEITEQDVHGGITASFKAGQKVLMPKTVWVRDSHNAQVSGTLLLKRLLPDRAFPFPKSVYAVEDALRFFIKDKPQAIILDFFSGSGTTAHAVMRLNRQDQGCRQCISVTNNEVAAAEQMALREQGRRPGDSEWEKWGIADYITKPRIAAAITGRTPGGEPINGDYKFTDEFPMAEGFAENAEFFTLTYEAPLAVDHNRAFERIAPLLWLRAGSLGRRIETVPTDGWAVVDAYGLLTDLDCVESFCAALARAEGPHLAFIVTNDNRRYEAVARQLPEGVEPVRLYESYLNNFRFASGGEE